MIRRSPLRNAHLELGARLVEFAGWEMPLQYQGIIHEHGAVRTRAGLFDVSHLGKLVVQGPGAAEALDRLLPGKVAGLPPWTAGYNLVLDDSGGIVDDVFVYRHPGPLEQRDRRPAADLDDTFLVVPNAANARRVFDFMETRLGGGVTVRDAHLDWAIIALSGPKSREILGNELQQARILKVHQFARESLDSTPLLLARTGYTGELTFEILVQSGQAERVWDRLFELGSSVGLAPAGLGARDLLRLEMGYPLHGQDISVKTNPLEANLDWLIEWDKNFPGKPALKKSRLNGPDRKLAGLIAGSRRIPRRGARLLHGDEDVGEVTSGGFSPSLDAGIALGYVRSDLTHEGTSLNALLDGKSIPVQVTRTPFLEEKRRSPARRADQAVKGSV